MAENVMNEEIVEEMNDNSEEVQRLKEELRNLTPGSEEHSRLVDDICKLEKADTDRYKVVMDAENTTAKIDNEKDRSDAEMRLRTTQATNEIRRSKRVRPDTIASIVGTLGLFGGCCIFQAKGHALPTSMLQQTGKLLRMPNIF